ncbi:MAG: DUF2244 domain-containing protein [Alphaproteobacteria bacterium]|nr:DUF2244 domain-containing protein [Alphaproteobacteria bacterium]
MSAVTDDLPLDKMLLDTVLRPAPTLPPRALLVILAVVASINLAFALNFILRGAWPVLPFLGADVALLAWAFRASRKAAEREEHVTLTPSLLRIVRRPAMTETALNPYWVRVQVEEQPGRLTLWSHGKVVRIGQFLPPAERISFAERLKAALHRARTTASFGS